MLCSDSFVICFPQRCYEIGRSTPLRRPACTIAAERCHEDLVYAMKQLFALVQ